MKISNPFKRRRPLQIRQVTIHQEKCAHCGLCTRLAPEVFQFDRDGNVRAAAGITLNNQGLVISAINHCPAIAIDMVRQ